MTGRGASVPPWAAVLFDRDDTLIHDVPYNGDPERVRVIDGVPDALARLRGAGFALGVVSNQSGVARGLLRPWQVRAVNEAVERVLGPFEVWRMCMHGVDDGCSCRKPAPGLVLSAAAALGVAPAACVVIGDTGADVDAALAAGARAMLVPTARTLPDEVRRARRAAEVFTSVPEAVGAVLAGARRPTP